MKPSPRIALVSSVLATGALLSLGTPGDSIDFRPSEDSVLTKSFTTEFEFALEDVLITMNGEEMPPEMLGGDIDLDDASGTASFSLEVVDEYPSVADGRPQELIRTYSTVHMESEFAGETDEEDHDVQGMRVRFAWDEEEEAYTREVLDDDEIDEEELEELGEDLDARVLLPGRAVEDGDSWKVAWEDCSSLLMPGFAFDAEIALDEDVDEIPPELLEQLGELFEGGALVCTYAGSGDVDGSSIATIELSSSSEGSVDLSDALLDAIGDELPPEAEMELTVLIEVAVELEGEMLWNLDAGHLHSMDFEATVNIDFDGEMYMEMMQMDMGAEAEAIATLRRSVIVE